LERREARIQRHKTGDADYIEMSDRVTANLRAAAPDICPSNSLVFTTPGGSPIRYENFLRRAWDPVALGVFGKSRRVTPHCLRHTWASLHLAKGTPIEWVRRMGGWASAKMLLDVYGHFIPREMQGHSNALEPVDRTRPNQGVGRGRNG
jgi:integrase